MSEVWPGTFLLYLITRARKVTLFNGTIFPLYAFGNIAPFSLRTIMTNNKKVIPAINYLPSFSYTTLKTILLLVHPIPK